ncbi:hypothetical protein CP09DC79_1185B, partial [Chlamydia psittaci 09DC79]
QVGLHFLWY